MYCFTVEVYFTRCLFTLYEHGTLCWKAERLTVISTIRPSVDPPPVFNRSSRLAALILNSSSLRPPGGKPVNPSVDAHAVLGMTGMFFLPMVLLNLRHNLGTFNNKYNIAVNTTRKLHVSSCLTHLRTWVCSFPYSSSCSRRRMPGRR